MLANPHTHTQTSTNFHKQIIVSKRHLSSSPSNIYNPAQSPFLIKRPTIYMQYSIMNPPWILCAKHVCFFVLRVCSWREAMLIKLLFQGHYEQRSRWSIVSTASLVPGGLGPSRSIIPSICLTHAPSPVTLSSQGAPVQHTPSWQMNCASLSWSCAKWRGWSRGLVVCKVCRGRSAALFFNVMNPPR